MSAKFSMSKINRVHQKHFIMSLKLEFYLDDLDTLPSNIRHTLEGRPHCDVVLVSCIHRAPSVNGSSLKGKNGSKFFPFRVDAFLEGVG